ncbi:MAG: hypothetical protein FJ098_12040 [Deltaproteobacteria bacterium]|nr:hypothetical protein [Deltaproteobacteria bacterium]
MTRTRVRQIPALALVACAVSCGNGGTGSNIQQDGVAGADTDVWPADLYRGEVDLFTDGHGGDLDVPVPEDVPITFDTDYIPGDGAVVIPVDTNPEQWADGVCVPACALGDGTPAECGPDGCGSLCGVCGFGEECKEGRCVEECLADCSGRVCGPDPLCNESCGECDPGFTCNPAGTCDPACDPEENCAGKECGADKCGGVCGTCPAGEVCTGDQLCEPPPCGDVAPGVGKCDGQFLLVQCIGNELVETDCKSFGDKYWCGYDALDGVYECVQGCVPVCEFPDGKQKECGYDGCYGICGECPGGWSCVSGLCNPAEGASCGWVPATGACYEDVLWFCDGGILYHEDCAALGLDCEYSMQQFAFICG